MRLPRDLSGADLAKKLKAFGYEVTRQTGSHMRITTILKGEHHVTIPHHASLRTGTLAAILADVSEHLNVERRELMIQLFGK